MSRILSLLLVLSLMLAAMPINAVQAVPEPFTDCSMGTQITINGSNSCLWVPLPPLTPAWNGDLVIFAHGYVDPNEAVVPKGAIPYDQLTITDPTNGSKTQLPAVLLGMGYAFAITSYSKNGLAVQEGVQAVTELAEFAKTSYPGLKHIYLVGASEGGLVTALAIEKNPDKLFDGGVTTCGPVGDFKQQVNYWGDFKVVFDYFFPTFKDPAPFSAIYISPLTTQKWYIGLVPNNPDPNTIQKQILGALAQGATKGTTQQLLSVTKAPVDPNNPDTVGLTVLGILDYNIRATNEARVELNNGQPFDNRHRLYWGALNNSALNAGVARFSADAAALTAMKDYQTTGKIQAPLVALHTTSDPIVPFWHEPLYFLKVLMAGRVSKFFSIPVVRYGHCAFTAKEAIFAFAVMVFKATGQVPLALLTPQTNSQTVLTLDDYNQMMQQYEPKQYEPKLYFVPMTNN